ncbi:MAG: hypothetical protein M3198_14375 [Actinomycetota bacterium]|nr:hypothetical protein [Actinomycetota bacterium]
MTKPVVNGRSLLMSDDAEGTLYPSQVAVGNDVLRIVVAVNPRVPEGY